MSLNGDDNKGFWCECHDCAAITEVKNSAEEAVTCWNAGDIDTQEGHTVNKVTQAMLNIANEMDPKGEKGSMDIIAKAVAISRGFAEQYSRSPINALWGENMD